MNTSIISQLVLKDLRLWRKMITIFCVAGVACVGVILLLHNRMPNIAFLNLGFTLLVVPAGTLGMVLLMQTSVFEKAKSTQPFIMSLPVTATDFAVAKLLVNIPVFAAAWAAATATAFYFAYGHQLLPPGTIPFITMIFLGIFVAYICILSVSLVTQSLGMTVLAITFFEILTSAYLWGIALFVAPIRDNLYGAETVWNTTAVSIIVAQVGVAAIALVTTLFLQCRRRDLV